MSTELASISQSRSTKSTRRISREPSADVLVVEDDEALATVLAAALGARGYGVETVASAADGLAAARRADVILLDLGLPDRDGIDVCRDIRRTSEVPIIVLTADGAEDRKVAALDQGADDYVTKPFSTRELLARIRVALRHRRSAPPDAEVLVVGDVVVDLAHRWVTVGGSLVTLTPKEFDLLAALARHPGRVMTHNAILSDVWGPDGEDHVEYLRVYFRALRKKLGEDSARPRLLTEAGVGYRLIDRGQ